jgi:hypothetical protein
MHEACLTQRVAEFDGLFIAFDGDANGFSSRRLPSDQWTISFAMSFDACVAYLFYPLILLLFMILCSSILSCVDTSVVGLTRPVKRIRYWHLSRS